MAHKLIFVAIALVLVLSGCAGVAKKDPASSALLEPQATLKFADLPVPAGFRIISEQSYSFESAGVRVGLLKYQGKADVDQVVNFYKEQMAMYNWNLLNVVEYGERIMNFDRETETCIVNLLTKGGQVIISISVGPKAQQLPRKTSQKPIK